MSHTENIEKLGSCATTAELDDILTTVSTLPAKDFPEDVKRSYYKALELLDPSLLSNAKIRRRLKRLQESLFIEGCEDPNSKFIIQLRGVANMNDLQTCMDGYKLELSEQPDGYSVDSVASYRLLVETLLDVIKRSEEADFMTKAMKRRITRLIFVISNQVLGLGPKKANTPAAEKTTPAVADAAASEKKSDKKRTIDQVDDTTAPTPVTALRETVPMESVEAALAVLKQHASLEAGDTKAVLDACVLMGILDLVIALVKETFEDGNAAGTGSGAAPASATTLTSQKRRLLRRALDRVDITDYPKPKSGVSPEHKQDLLLHLKHTDVMEFLGSGDNAAMKANYAKYFPAAPAKGKKRRKGGEDGAEAVPVRKYTVFIGQLSFYTTEPMLRKFIDQKLGYASENNESDGGTGGSSGAYQVRLLTDKVSKEEKEAQEDPRARVSTKRSCRGMGFVDFYSMEEQGKALKLLHHAPFNGRVINVERTEPKLGKAKREALSNASQVEGALEEKETGPVDAVAVADK